MRSLVLALLLPLSALADEATGKVVRVQDGDTLTVLVDRTQLKVRLLDIDAPELGQPFGRRSRQSLDSICAARSARVVWTDRDHYGRILGQVTCAGVNANSSQVRNGTRRRTRPITRSNPKPGAQSGVYGQTPSQSLRGTGAGESGNRVNDKGQSLDRPKCRRA
jgi:endonuclease YncB( thermonuclease family)